MLSRANERKDMYVQWVKGYTMGNTKDQPTTNRAKIETDRQAMV